MLGHRFLRLASVLAIGVCASLPSQVYARDEGTCDAGGPGSGSCSITQGAYSCSVSGCSAGTYPCCKYGPQGGTPTCKCELAT